MLVIQTEAFFYYAVVVEENVVKLPKRIQSSSLTTDDSGVPSRVIDKRPSPSAVVAAKNNRKLKPEQREKFAKIKRPELDRHGKEISFNKNFLGYIQTCLLLGNKIRALKSVQFYRQRHALGKGPAVKDVAIYNTLLHGFAADVSWIEFFNNSNYTRIPQWLTWFIS